MTSFLYLFFIYSFLLFPKNSASFAPLSNFSIIDYDVHISKLSGDDYGAPASPPSSPPLQPSFVSCKDLRGIGSLNTTCELSYSLNFTDDIYIQGSGNLFILQGVVLTCLNFGCSIEINMMGAFRLSPFAEIISGSIRIAVGNASLFEGSVINVTARAIEPSQPSPGTPDGVEGGGGGHGGRGASCVMDNKKFPEDVWGGDAYAWDSLDEPWSFGSTGGTTSREQDYGGRGGGRIWLETNDLIDMRGMLLAEGGDGGIKGGGGSGGSIYIKSQKLIGNGKLCASGGNGFAGGGGGRVSINVFSRHDELIFLIHGGRSLGCPTNAGAAGTLFDAVPRRLVINNYNMSTDTDTLLLQFPNQPLWTNVDIQNHARATVPLLWSRVQVRGQLSLTCGSVLSFGLVHYPFSEFELMAEELLMSSSVIKVYGALRMSVKIHLMLNSRIFIDGNSDAIVATSLLEASNLLVLKGSSTIYSTANLGLHGQGSLNLSGPGDVVIEAQHLVLSLFYAINVGPGSVLRGPLENASSSYKDQRLYCGQKDCPSELLQPPKNCDVNASLSFTVQICRVEDITVEGIIEGSVVHLHRVRTLVVKQSGSISASGMGCLGGWGHGILIPNGPSSGAGHGGKGGGAFYGGTYISGGGIYGNVELPCELGSGSGNENRSRVTTGGGVIVMGSLEQSLSKLVVHGNIKADGESYGKFMEELDGGFSSDVGLGGGSGGTILIFVHSMVLHDSATISTSGGHGSPNGGGGGGGRIHFHWSDIPSGDEYMPMAIVKGDIVVRGGAGRGMGQAGEDGTVSGIACPAGLYGILCEECPLGTYKNVTGSERALCRDCPPLELPHRATFVPVRGGVTDAPCPYKCVSDRYHMPHCYTSLEELIYTFGGPWLFGFVLLSFLILLALVLSVARMKFASVDELPGPVPNRRASPIDHSFPFLESLNEVLETCRTEESQTHVHRMYFMGANTFAEPWHLPHSPPKEVKELVYEDAFNRFVDEINALASYQWWEGSVYSILCITAYPLAWSWLHWRRKEKVQRLREYVRSEYDHACLRSCRSRALYEGLKVAATSDLMLAYVDFFLGGDEKRDDLPPRLHQRLPMSLVFGGDGSYMAPFSLQGDNILTNLMSQSIPPTIWYRLVAGLNAQLRLVRHGHLRATFRPVVSWLETHANRKLRAHGVRVNLTRFQPSVSGYCQYGLIVSAADDETTHSSVQVPFRSPLIGKQSRAPANRWKKALDLVRVNEQAIMQKKICGEILHANSLQILNEKLTINYPFYYMIRNIKPVFHEDLIGLIMSVLLLGDFSLVLLLLLQLYSISLLDVFLVLSILPLGILLPFPAGINALFSHGPRRSASLARIYALWNITSMINVIVAFLCGLTHFRTQSSSKRHPFMQAWNLNMDESGWWMLPSGLILCKIIQAHLIDYHVGNLEIQDRTLYCSDTDVFWQS